jgi:PAS domain S-box-containing protein
MDVNKSNKKKLNMRTTSGPGNFSNKLPNNFESGYNFLGELEEKNPAKPDTTSALIENAGGVPYQFIFDNSSAKGYFFNTGNGIKDLFGVSREDFNGDYFNQSIEQVVPLVDNISCDRSESMNQIIKSEINKYRADLLVKTADGERKWIRDTAVPIKDNNNGVIGISGIFWDINDSKSMQSQLEKARERATESDRLKTAFLNNLSHEIRTPLNAIVGFTTLLGEPGVHSNSKMEFMDIITHSSDHLLEIVDDIVEISKIETQAVRLIMKETNLTEMLHRVYNRFKPAADEKKINIKLIDMVNNENIIIVTDGYKLFQSLNNLVSNAVKFTKQGMVEFGINTKDGKIQFFVRDTGIGIALQDKPYIFKPFYQAVSSSSQRYFGTGLGLTISKAYIELLGGQIWFSSEEGRGSTFCFNIPDSRKLLD